MALWYFSVVIQIITLFGRWCARWSKYCRDFKYGDNYDNQLYRQTYIEETARYNNMTWQRRYNGGCVSFITKEYVCVCCMSAVIIILLIVMNIYSIVHTNKLIVSSYTITYILLCLCHKSKWYLRIPIITYIHRDLYYYYYYHYLHTSHCSIVSVMPLCIWLYTQDNCNVSVYLYLLMDRYIITCMCIVWMYCIKELNAIYC